METFNIYQDIAERTGGDIYIGVVGLCEQGNRPLSSDLWICWCCRTLQTPTRGSGRRTNCRNRQAEGQS